MAAGSERPRLQLLEWKRIDKGALVGRATVLLPSGLQIGEVGVFTKEGRNWAQLPSELMRDGEGQPVTDSRGKARYRSALKWTTRELQDGFSAAVVQAIEAQHGSLA